MKKDLVEMVFILDRSGSMAGLEKQTIDGFNELLEKQRHVKGEAIISTVLFDNEFEVLHNRENIQDVKMLTNEDYFVRGSTALLDAVGRSIRKISHVHRQLKEAYVPEKTIFMITTDGMENASHEFNYDSIKKMIGDQKEKYGWEFIFLGANIDAIAEAKKFGIHADRAVNYHADREGTTLNFEVLDEAVHEFRVNRSISPEWKNRIDADYNSRKAQTKK